MIRQIENSYFSSLSLILRRIAFKALGTSVVVLISTVYRVRIMNITLVLNVTLSA